MHPYQHVFLHRGPSRIFWFFVGAGVATCWHYSSTMHDHRAQYFPCVMQHRHAQDSPSEGDAPWNNSSWDPDRTPTRRNWGQDGERLRHIQKRAGETVVELSESTLDSIVAGAGSLKAKLVELRAERERLEAEKKVDQLGA